MCGHQFTTWFALAGSCLGDQGPSRVFRGLPVKVPSQAPAAAELRLPSPRSELEREIADPPELSGSPFDGFDHLARLLVGKRRRHQGECLGSVDDVAWATLRDV